MKNIAQSAIELPPEAPVMFLPGAVLFPGALMPLFIFEPRYRAMLAHTLEQPRMFCIATMRPGVEQARGPEDFFDVAGLGLVRACVAREDGTLHLVLQGLARVRLGQARQRQPFHIAEVTELPTVGTVSPAARALCDTVRERCAALPHGEVEGAAKIAEQLAQIDEPGALADVVEHTFVRDPFRRQEALEELNALARLRAVARHLGEEMLEP